ncbi:MAG TPA: CaiB/BaiF CoA-transferase family protein [Marinobacterium sp.]|nr:CaiB/BaiF CoA-transferase family protein [Marinobacterium sp.]
MKQDTGGSSLPLADIRVLELGQLIAGPYCGQVLADFGADVLKIEPPGKGDAMRQWGASDEAGKPIWWNQIARNKQSMTLDLRQADGQDVLRQLVADADVLIENFRPGTMEKWGLGYEELSAINPKLIMVRVTGFGQNGPYSQRAGYASVCEAMGGLRYVSGYPDRPPVRVGISLGDTLAGVHAALGALVAIHQRERSGRGQVVDSTIYESVFGMMESIIPDYVLGGKVRERSGSILPGIAPSNAYPAKGGRDVIIGANQDSVFTRLCEVMGRSDLSLDERFSSHRARGANQTELDELIGEWSAGFDAEELVNLLSKAGVPCGLVYSAPEMLADPHFQARESIVQIADAQGRQIPMQNVFPRLSQTPGKVRHVGPELGAHTDETLSQRLGLPEDRIQNLRERGII